MSYIGVPPQATFSSGLLDRFTSTTGTTVTLTNDIASENDIVVFVNFVKQDSTTYSVGGTGNKTLTLGGSLVSSDIVEVHYLNIVGQTNAPSAGSVTTATINDTAVTGAKLNADVISSQTELATAPATTDELLISDAGVLKRVDVSLVGGSNKPAWHAFLSSSQNVGSSSETVIVFDSEVFDSDSAYDTSNGKFTVPSGQAGKYYVYASCMRNNFFNSRYIVKINVGGTQKISAEERNSDSGGTTFDTVGVAGILDLSASDEVTVSLFQDSGSSAGANGGTSSKSFFMGFKLIGL